VLAAMRAAGGGVIARQLDTLALDPVHQPDMGVVAADHLHVFADV
jgi:hypothetical protein